MAQRLRRVFDIDISDCPFCGGTLGVVGDVTDPEVISRILEHLRCRGESRAPPARASSHTPDLMNLLAVQGSGGALQAGDGMLQMPRQAPAGDRTLGFRPEHARLGRAEAGQLGLELRDCETQAVEHLGGRAFCYLRCAIGELVVVAPDDGRVLQGSVHLAIDVSALHYFDEPGTRCDEQYLALKAAPGGDPARYSAA